MRASQPNDGDIELLLENARLRDALEPYLDEAVDLIDVRRLPTNVENEFLNSMLAWERAPVLAIADWFEPRLVLPHPADLDDEQLHRVLWKAIHRLHDARVVLDFTDHLSDRQLYCLIFRDILPSHEKKIDLPKNYLHWHCIDIDEDTATWLTYYATEQERQVWQKETGSRLPPAKQPPYPRQMPRRPA